MSTHSWRPFVPRGHQESTPTLLPTSSSLSGSLTGAKTTAVSDIVFSMMKVPPSAIIAGAIVSTLSSVIIAFGIFRWLKDRRRARNCMQEGQTSRNERGRIVFPYQKPSSHESSTPVAISDPFVITAARVCRIPPTLAFSPGWSYLNDGWVCEKRAHHKSASEPALFNYIPFDTCADIMVADLEVCRPSLSTVGAEAGSAGPSTAPSRSASMSQPSIASVYEKIASAAALPHPDIPSTNETERYRCASLRWSWSDRATYSSTYDAEMLPAYSARRSRSTTRSWSRRSSAVHANISAGGDVSVGHAASVNLSPPEYPLELARKIVQAYSRTPSSPDPPDSGS
ncbi:hypothetical protein DFH11DRAFT_138731 [Phellopilus nigrolimitatus]|nr:hypothetical protein DFH11DRAFT_138731 [Phellopilus nigrolimitatus]